MFHINSDIKHGSFPIPMLLCSQSSASLPSMKYQYNMYFILTVIALI